VNDLFRENYKPLKKTTESGKISHAYGLADIVNMAILPKAIYMFNTIPINIPMTFITETEKSTLKFVWKPKRLRIAKAILSKNSNTGDITIPDFKLYYRAIAIKITWYWYKNRHEDPDMNSHSYTCLIFDKVPKTYDGEDSLFNKCSWKNWLSPCRKLKLDPSLSPCTSINSKFIKDLNIGPETLKLVKERAGNTLEATGITNDFLSRTKVAQQRRERIDKWDYIKKKRRFQDGS
jgi:hypothetical protein